jgi:hypothetical protein
MLGNWRRWLSLVIENTDDELITSHSGELLLNRNLIVLWQWNAPLQDAKT